MPLAISYARFSSGKQQFGHSLARQLESTRVYCVEHGLTLDETIHDLGLSAFKGRHLDKDAGLGRLRDRIRSGDIPRGSILIAEAHDRLSRLQPRLAMQLFLEIINAGVEVVTLIDRQRYSAETVDQNVGQLFVSIGMMLGSHMESRNKSDRVRAARQTARQAATDDRKLMTKMVPAWLDVVGGKPVPNSGAAIVRRIFQDVASGLGTYTVARRLNAERIPTLSGSKKSNGWNKSRILSIVQSDAPLGWFQPHIRDGERRKPIGEPIKNYYPAIVEQSVADLARQMISTRRFGGEGAGRKGTVMSNIFTGMAKCGVCGGSMFLSHRHAPSSRTGWLRCSRAVRNAGVDKQACTNNVGIPYASLELSVIERTRWELYLPNRTQDNSAQEVNEKIARKRSEAKKIEESIATILEAFADSPIPVIKIQIERMGERHSDILKEIEILEKTLSKHVMRSDISSIDWERTGLTEKLASPDQDERFKARTYLATTLRLVINRMDCKPDKSVTLWCHPIQSEVHRIQASISFDMNKSLNESEIGPFPELTVSLMKKPEVVRTFPLGILPTSFACAAIFKAEKEGRTFLDLWDDHETNEVEPEIRFVD